MRLRLATVTALVVGLLAAAGAVAQGDRGPVVVELFTSQGCSACPPADRLLAELAERDDVLALALHVDYWDYIGWSDTFASPAFSARQSAYAKNAGHGMLYTPEMIVGGRDEVAGTKAMKIARLIERHADAPEPVAVDLRRDGTRVTVDARPRDGAVGPAVVQIFAVRPWAEVDIAEGENAGRRLTYNNIVTDLAAVGRWDGAGPFSAAAEVPEDHAVAAVVQVPDHGPVLGAAQLP